MSRKYSQEDVERILKSDTEIPKSVEQRIRDTYRELGLTDSRTGNADGSRPAKRRRHKAWVSVAAAAAVVAGLSITAVAATHFLNVRITEEDGKVAQKVTVDPTAKEAHKIEISNIGYIPEGYVYQEDGPRAGKYHNEATGGGMTIVPFDAAAVYWYSSVGNPMLDIVKDEEAFIGTTETSGMTVNIFQDDTIYTDDNTIMQNVYLFNEEEGYVIWVHVSGPDLPDGEAKKVAESIEVKVLDETVTYATDEEIQEEIKTSEVAKSVQEKALDSIDSSCIFQIGEAVSAPEFFPADPSGSTCMADAQYTVKDVQVVDSLPLDQYPKENYVPDYDSEVLPLLNEDGTFKTHDRYPVIDGVIQEGDVENAQPKIVLATVDITNTADSGGEFYIAPHITLLTDEGDGTYSMLEYQEATKAYSAVSVDGSPFYQSVQQFTDNYKKDVYFAYLKGGETLECTFAFVVDEDNVDNAYLGFFDSDGSHYDYPRVKVTE